MSDEDVGYIVNEKGRTSPEGTAAGMVVVNVVNSYEENFMGAKDEAPHSAIFVTEVRYVAEIRYQGSNLEPVRTSSVPVSSSSRCLSKVDRNGSFMVHCSV